MPVEFGMQFDGKVCTDASAAIGMVFRRGRGRTRHIDVQYLWVQAEVAEGRLQVEKVHTWSNPADLLTKAVGQDIISRHLEALDLRVDATRAAGAPKLGQVATWALHGAARAWGRHELRGGASVAR